MAQAPAELPRGEYGIKPPEPITVLIPPEKASPEMLKQMNVESGGVAVETPQGRIGVELYAFPAPESETQIPFLQRVLLRKKAEKPAPVQVAIEPTVQYDEFEKGGHTPLMGWYPHAVLQDGTRYGVIVTVPTSLIEQEWGEQKERPRTTETGMFFLPVTVWEDGVEYEVKEVYRQRKGLGAVVRVDGKHPLVQRQMKGSSGQLINRELLLGGFERAKRVEGVSCTGISQRVTEISNNDKKVPRVGTEVESKAIVEDLIFRLVDEEGAEAPEKEKGVVEVIVFETTEDEVTEVIKTPKPKLEMWQPSSSLDLVGGGTLSYGMKGGTKTFQTGETTFGEPKKEKVTIRGVKDAKPLAAFRMVLVGENITEGLEMKEAQPEVVEPQTLPEVAE